MVCERSQSVVLVRWKDCLVKWTACVTADRADYVELEWTFSRTVAASEAEMHFQRLWQRNKRANDLELGI